MLKIKHSTKKPYCLNGFRVLYVTHDVTEHSHGMEQCFNETEVYGYEGIALMRWSPSERLPRHSRTLYLAVREYQKIWIRCAFFQFSWS